MKTGLDKSDLKAKAITIARTLVRTYGYEKFRLSDVAKEMNISHAALYKYFTNKDELLDAVNAEWLEEIDSTLSKIAFDKTIPPKERIKKWFMQLYVMKRDKVLADLEPYSAFMVAVEHKKPFVKEHLDVQFEQLRSMVAEAFPDKDPALTTNRLLDAMMLYHHPLLVKNGVHHDKSGELASLVDTLIKGFS